MSLISMSHGYAKVTAQTPRRARTAVVPTMPGTPGKRLVIWRANAVLVGPEPALMMGWAFHSRVTKEA